MPHYLILAPDRDGTLDERIAGRQDHIEYWTDKPGVVKVAGATLDGDRPNGSAFLIEASDEAEARALLAADPFATLGIFTDEVQVIAMRPAIGAWLPKP